MVSFSSLDFTILLSFFAVILFIGFYPKKEKKGDADGYLLSGRQVGLFLFVMTNVSTWYGGILGIGEFTYRYGLLSWVTQGLPYYILAILFALFFAGKIRKASLFTIPDKLEEVYGKKVGMVASIIVFVLVSPAPYLLMTANILSLIFNIGVFEGALLSVLFTGLYQFKGGYKSNLFTDVFQFFMMFAGFGLIVFISYTSHGGVELLRNNLPANHLKLFSDVSPLYIIIWFLIALWTFADPGFHQRCYSAKSGSVAKWGIIISVFFWFLFDFLTTSTGLFARAALPNLANPVLSFPLYAERILGSGAKGFFFAAMFATIFSTLNSFFFLSATTFGRDFIFKYKKNAKENMLPTYTRVGLIAAAIIAVLFTQIMQSVISIWYSIGSICIPGIILLVFGAYYEKLKVPHNYALIEIISGVAVSFAWLELKNYSLVNSLNEIEPMIIGLISVIIIHTIGVFKLRSSASSSAKVQ